MNIPKTALWALLLGLLSAPWSLAAYHLNYDLDVEGFEILGVDAGDEGVLSGICGRSQIPIKKTLLL